MATAMTNAATPAPATGNVRTRAVLSDLDGELTSLAGDEGSQDGAAMTSHHTPSPTRGERVVAMAAHRGQGRFNDALELDALDRTREIAKVDDVSQRVGRGETVHPPLRDSDLGLRARFPGEVAALAVVGGIEAKLLADPIQTTLNLASWKESFVTSSVIIVLVVALSHLFADAWIRARDTTVPAIRDALRPVAAGLAAVVVLTGAMVVVARAFSQNLVAGSAGSEWEAWVVFVIFQLVFVTANLALAVRERDVRLQRWLAALRDRRTSIEAAGSEQALTLLHREFWTIVYRALCHYRSELQTANGSGPFKAGWDNRTSADLSQRQLLRQVFPSAPVDPTPDLEQEDEPAEVREEDGPRVAPEPHDDPGGETHDEPPTPAEQEEPLGRVRRAAGDPPQDPPDGDDESVAVDVTNGHPAEETDADLDDLIAQVLGEAGEDAA